MRRYLRGFERLLLVFVVKEVSPASKTLFFELLGFQKPFSKKKESIEMNMEQKKITFSKHSYCKTCILRYIHAYQKTDL